MATVDRAPSAPPVMSGAPAGMSTPAVETKKSRAGPSPTPGGWGGPSSLQPLLPDSAATYEKKVRQKDQTIASLREHMRSMETAMATQKNEMNDLRLEAKRLAKRNKDKSYLTSQLKHEIDERISRDKKIESLKNCLDWGNVGLRHEVEHHRNSLVKELDDATNKLTSKDVHCRRLKSENKLFSSKLQRAKEETQTLQTAFLDMKQQAEERLAIAAQDAASTRVAHMEETNAMQNQISSLTTEVNKQVARGDGLYKKLGSVNVLLVLQRMISLKRAELNAHMHEQIEAANAKLVEKGCTPVTTAWMEDSVRKGFTHKLKHLADERQANFEHQEELDARRAAVDAQAIKLMETEAALEELKMQTREEAERVEAEHTAVMARVKADHAALLAEKEEDIQRMMNDQAEVVSMAVSRLKKELDARIAEGEEDRAKLNEKLFTTNHELEEWKEKYDGVCEHRAQIQRETDSEIKGLKEQSAHALEQREAALRERAQFEQGAKRAEDECNAAEAAAEDAKLHSITLATDLERLRSKLKAIDTKEQDRIDSLTRTDSGDAPDTGKLNLKLKEKVGGLELTVRSQMEDINRLRESGKHTEDQLHKITKEVMSLREKIGMKDDLIRDREKKIAQMREALKTKFEKMQAQSLAKDVAVDAMNHETGVLKKEIAFGKVAHEKTKEEMAALEKLRSQQVREACQGIMETILNTACVQGEFNKFQREMQQNVKAIQTEREEDLEAWRKKADRHAQNSKQREEEISKKLEQTMFDAGQAHSRAKALDEQLSEANKRSMELQAEEADLTKWKATLFEKVDQLRSENEQLENGLRMSAEEIERLQKRIQYLDARRDELKQSAAQLAAENEALRADKRVAALDAELQHARSELATVSAEAMRKEEEMSEMKAKFANVMDKMGGLQMGTSLATSESTAGGAAGQQAQLSDAKPEDAEPAGMPPISRKPPAGASAKSRHFDLPNAEEIHKYAVHLGVDPVGDKEFLWLAEEALCAPLPPHWTEHMDAEKGVYYYNSNTGESVWEHPMDDYYRGLFKSLHKNKEEMKKLSEEQNLFQLSQVGLKTNALLKEHNQVLASLMLAENPNSRLSAPNMLLKAA